MAQPRDRFQEQNFHKFLDSLIHPKIFENNTQAFVQLAEYI